MSLVEMSLRRPVTTVMVFLSLVVVGLLAAARLPLEFLPEVEFPFDGLVDLRDPETNERIEVDADGYRHDYLAAIGEFRQTYRRECQKSHIDYVPLDTSMPFDRALMEYLISRRNWG
mgnify:CR=1 FL=1